MIDMDKCYACGKRFRDVNNRQDVFLEDDGHQTVLVGPECFRKVVKAAAQGYKPPKGGPRLFIEKRYAVAAAEVDWSEFSRGELVTLCEVRGRQVAALKRRKAAPVEIEEQSQGESAERDDFEALSDYVE